MGFVNDKLKRIVAKDIPEMVFAKCVKFNDDWMRTKRNLNSYKFIYDGISMMRAVLGDELFSCMIHEALMQHKTWKRSLRLWKLCMKIQGRKCAYSECSNQESRDGVIEKYKICSGC